MIADGPRALLLNGTVGVGKSSLAEAIAAPLSTRGIPNAYLDMMSSTHVDSARNFVRAGVERLVLAGVTIGALHSSSHRCADLGIEVPGGSRIELSRERAPRPPLSSL